MKIVKKIAKITGIIILSVLFIILGVVTYSYVDISNRKDKTYTITPEPIHVSYDSATVALGQRLSLTRACGECHGADFGGNVLHDDAMVGRLVAKNITKGEGGLPADFSEKDWVMAMKHGLDRNGKPLYLMPSHELSQLTEGDMAALIAYMSQVPKVDRKPVETRIGPLGYVLTEFGMIPLLPAELTDHTLPFSKPIMKEVSVEYGKYVASICINCHGENFKGGESPVPGGKYVADISSTGNPGKWTTEEFITALHTGVTPEGKQLNPQEMPWTITKNFTKEELAALHLYLKTL